MALPANQPVDDVYHVPTNDTSKSTMMIETGMYDTVWTTPMWKKIFISQFVLIFIFNTFTLIGIAGNRNLRKRTLFLVINLAVADLLGE